MEALKEFRKTRTQIQRVEAETLRFHELDLSPRWEGKGANFEIRVFARTWFGLESGQKKQKVVVAAD